VRPLRILTWHVHGSYLSYLSRIRHHLYVPFRPGRPDGYGGRTRGFRWPDSLHELPADEVPKAQFDAVVYQHHRNWLVDRLELAEWQRSLPSIYLEHDPPRESPTEAKHPVDDPNVLVVHVTHFNRLMWDSGRSPSRVIEHGVSVPEAVRWIGERRRGITVVNNLARRDRRVGPDVFEHVRRSVPLDLVGMNADDLGGIGEVPLHRLPAFEAPYRFLFNPIRWTSLGLAVCEAMMIGMPVVGLATTGMVGVVDNGVSGYLDNDPDALVAHMERLLGDHGEAHHLSLGAAAAARRRFGIDRFVRDWEQALALVTATRPAERTGEEVA
jgi:glycosyltransferase involved in cell wall biosynthesis